MVCVSRFVAICVAAACLATPAPASAQRQVFVAGFIDLTSAVAGTFGDEGPRVRAALDRMAAGLDVWDEEIEALEANRPAPGRNVLPATAFQIHVALAVAYAERPHFANALREIDAALGIQPQQANLHRLRALVLDAMGRTSEAGGAFRTAWQLDPADPGKAYLFLRSASSGPARDRAKARELLVDAYRQALGGSAPPARPFVQVGLLTDTAAASPVLPHAVYAEGYRLIARGDYRAAIAQLRGAAGADPLVTDPASTDEAIARGISALKQERIAEALPSLTTGVARVPGSSEAHRILALAYWGDGQDEASLRHLEAAIAINPLDERSRLTRARVLTEAGRTAEAATALGDTVRELPDSGLAHWWLASILDDLNDSSARQSFERAAAAGILAGRGRLYASIGRLAQVTGDFAGALEASQRRARATPNDTFAHTLLGHLYLARGRNDEAFEELVAALLLNPENAGAYAAIGQLYLNSGRHADAVGALRRALALHPADQESRYALASALLQSGDTESAARELDAFERAQRESLAGRRQTMVIAVLKEEARLRAAEGWHDRAAVLWQEAIEREPGQADSHVALAASLAAMGRVQAAIAQYETAVTLGAKAGSGVYSQLAALYASAGRPADSARARALSEGRRAQAGAGGGAAQ
jgi:tetratricopeptide (TPR) repeat protein